jgi:hypothetical protein
MLSGSAKDVARDPRVMATYLGLKRTTVEALRLAQSPPVQ